ncbi:threonylcarbamoyl-AMP synthase [Flavobacteriaceae bacterium TP-CH-4]|uniref:L-threonylcarbamoyladenylate synthase n=1 Tax=Pelagihabitans pacificus TaxID=2696054 RepID=A0A967B3D9_9FLAO|nr:L-threonylcarbamoyladenylate synthase [Pelagihabitans pacificus]NHF61286.1 threonylcarbamoyl-AMP synthase [Pelagihabitans pacificus]
MQTKENLSGEINKAIQVLEKGGLIVYPTDTIWGIGCDATNEDAVERIYQLKKKEDTKTLSCLVANDFMLEKYLEKVPEIAYDIIDLSEKPVTIIYDKPKGVAKNLIPPDNTLAIRVASDKFCRYLINKFGKPLVATDANISGRPTPLDFQEIDEAILKGADYVVNLNRNQKTGTPSSIIKLGNDSTVKIIRE